MKKSPVESAYVVILHGLGRKAGSMQKIARYLTAKGYTTINPDYPSTRHSINFLAENFLKNVIDQKCPEKKTINFVTHSMGGMLVRAFLKNNQLAQLGRVVMLGPPNQGSEVADKLGHLFPYKWIMGPSLKEMGTSEDCLPYQLGGANFELGVIAGNRSINLINSLMIPGDDDGKVSVERAKLRGMKDFIVVKRTHTFMMNAPEVWQYTYNFLRTGSFKS